jgi:hypothetical protein
VFDASNPLAPVEVAWFDTWPSDDQAQFNSLWNVYPYFPSGTVTGTDIEKGLFVWRVAGFPPPTVYCQAKANSQGCLPSIGYSGSPSMNSPAAFDITASNEINNKSGVLFYSLTGANLPFHGGTLCMTLPIQRTTVQNSGGSAAARTAPARTRSTSTLTCRAATIRRSRRPYTFAANTGAATPTIRRASGTG